MATPVGRTARSTSRSRQTERRRSAPSTSGFCFFFNDTATTEIYTLSLHDALPICNAPDCLRMIGGARARGLDVTTEAYPYIADRKSTRLNSSHVKISYAVFCL